MARLLRDIKRKMRRDLHGIMLVPAIYYATPDSPPLEITVRDFTKFNVLNGALPGGQHAQQYAKTEESEPKILFMVVDVPKPRVGAIVSVERGEAYRVATVQPPDDITITAKVTRIPASETVLLATLQVPA